MAKALVQEASRLIMLGEVDEMMLGAVEDMRRESRPPNVALSIAFIIFVLFVNKIQEWVN